MYYENMSLGEIYAERQALIHESLCLQRHIAELKAKARELEEEVTWKKYDPAHWPSQPEPFC